MIRVCPACGAENGLASVHCRNCGVKLPGLTTGMMGPPPAVRRNSFLRTVFWAFMLLGVGAAGFWVSEHANWRNIQSGAVGFYANWQNVQADVSDAMHRWYAKWLSVEPVPAPVSVHTPARSPVSTSASAPPSAPVPAQENTVKIRCKRCGGLGYVIFTEKTTRVDLEKRKHTITETKKEICLLCDQKGGRTITLPPGAEICPACYGMGRSVRALNGRDQVVPCEICVGKGYIIRKY